MHTNRIINIIIVYLSPSTVSVKNLQQICAGDIIRGGEAGSVGAFKTLGPLDVEQSGFHCLSTPLNNQQFTNN